MKSKKLFILAFGCMLVGNDANAMEFFFGKKKSQESSASIRGKRGTPQINVPNQKTLKPQDKQESATITSAAEEVQSNQSSSTASTAGQPLPADGAKKETDEAAKVPSKRQSSDKSTDQSLSSFVGEESAGGASEHVARQLTRGRSAKSDDSTTRRGQVPTSQVDDLLSAVEANNKAKDNVIKALSDQNDQLKKEKEEGMLAASDAVKTEVERAKQEAEQAKTSALEEQRKQFEKEKVQAEQEREVQSEADEQDRGELRSFNRSFKTKFNNLADLFGQPKIEAGINQRSNVQERFSAIEGAVDRIVGAIKTEHDGAEAIRRENEQLKQSTGEQRPQFEKEKAQIEQERAAAEEQEKGELARQNKKLEEEVSAIVQALKISEDVAEVSEAAAQPNAPKARSQQILHAIDVQKKENQTLKQGTDAVVDFLHKLVQERTVEVADEREGQKPTLENVLVKTGNKFKDLKDSNVALVGDKARLEKDFDSLHTVATQAHLTSTRGQLVIPAGLFFWQLLQKNQHHLNLNPRIGGLLLFSKNNLEHKKTALSLGMIGLGVYGLGFAANRLEREFLAMKKKNKDGKMVVDAEKQKNLTNRVLCCGLLGGVTVAGARLLSKDPMGSAITNAEMVGAGVSVLSLFAAHRMNEGLKLQTF